MSDRPGRFILHIHVQFIDWTPPRFAGASSFRASADPHVSFMTSIAD
jgi:hypothetical protein